MKKSKSKFVTVKVWRETLSKLRLVAALEEQPMAKIIDKMADYSLQKKENPWQK